MNSTETVGSLMQQSQVGHTHTVLVVDEDAKDLAYYSTILQCEGYDVRATTSYVQALSWLGSQRFDFIIVSQGTGEFEGQSVLERAIQLDRHLPVLVLARSLDLGCYSYAMHLGALDYYEKSLKPQELLRMVRNHLPSGK